MSFFMFFRPVQGGTTQVPSAANWKLGFAINNQNANQFVRVGNLDMDWSIGNRPVFRCQTLDPMPANMAAAYRPDLDQMFAVTDSNGNLIFGGYILTVDERPAEAPNTGVLLDISAVGFEAIADQRYVRIRSISCWCRLVIPVWSTRASAIGS
jgi:hypothetical protein